MRVRIDRGVAEDIAKHRSGLLPPPLAEYLLAAGELDDRIDGQEIGRVAARVDEPQLMLQQIRIISRRSFRKFDGKRGSGQLLQRVLRCAAGHDDLVGILVAQLAQVEGAAYGNVSRGADGVGISTEERRVGKECVRRVRTRCSADY